MSPPKPTLDWEEVVKYAFLADFDLLHEGQEDIRGERWAQPAGRAVMDQHYKLLRADEEIAWLNIKICRLVTYMTEEEVFLRREEGRLREEGKEGMAIQVGKEGMAIQVGLLRMERERFTQVHMACLVKLRKEPGCTANILPGVSICREHHTPVTRDRDVEMCTPSPPPPTEEEVVHPPANDDEEEAESEDDEGAVSEAFLNIVHIASDNAGDAGDA
ncbi:hypothetical protein DFH09DRAFT_1087965 [Mycena vulgaris]|nr:hypothetical protein DFH09DRAFT_1087965 [Mycena vulgaris]